MDALRRGQQSRPRARHRFRAFVAGAAVAAAGVASAAPTAAAERFAPAVYEASRLRAEFGLAADPRLVAALIESARDVGTVRWGIPMTNEEERSVDLAGRMRFADAVDMRVLPYLRKLGSYGGVYYDQVTGGGLTILLTARDRAVDAEITRRMPRGGPGWRIATVAHTEAELMAASMRARATWDRLATGVDAISFGLDTRGNGLFVSVAPPELSRATARVGALAATLGVPVRANVGHAEAPTHCSTRDHCHAPMKAGINIYKGSTSGSGCTMGFHIVRSGDEQFVTAGHCGYDGSNVWYHPAIANAIGSEVQTLYVNGGQDIMRVTMASDSEASDDIYNDGNDIVGSGSPSAGETLCASLGKGSNTVKCGTVNSTWVSYSFTTHGSYTIWGGDMSYTTVGGDSGSPVYRRLPGGTGDSARAIGVNSSTGGKFARLDTSLDDFAASVVQ